jgi:hypothetical protein
MSRSMKGKDIMKESFEFRDRRRQLLAEQAVEKQAELRRVHSRWRVSCYRVGTKEIYLDLNGKIVSSTVAALKLGRFRKVVVRCLVRSSELIAAADHLSCMQT